MCCAAKHQFVCDEITIVKQMMNFHPQTFWCVLKKAYCQELRGFESVKSELQIVIFLAHQDKGLSDHFWSKFVHCLLSSELFTFIILSSPKPLSHFQQNLVGHKASFKFIQMKGYILFLGEMKAT